MRVLALEGTAWAASAAIVDHPANVVAMESSAYTPASGGIHPREAAEHMADALPGVIDAVLEETAVEDVDAVAFSRGPGLGPCLRTVGTAARTLALDLEIPLVGVNHMVAHAECGRIQADFEDPICLNASGANAHVLGQVGDRYRILGETMDTGVGNAIDKFTRHLGWAHPGGPKVEARAQDGDYHELPYVVKGMDFSFAGITSAAIEAVDDGVPVADVCFSLQETIFAMLTEVTERALSVTGRDELVIGGGVGQNRRLQGMLRTMCEDRDARCFVPEDRLLRDNAAMIGMVGAAMARAGQTIAIEDSAIDPEYRPDEVTLTWRSPTAGSTPATETAARGAEAVIERDGPDIVKRRRPKPYRHSHLDDRLRRQRTADEARLTSLARRAGVPTPVLRDVDLEAASLVIEHVGVTDFRDRPTVDRARWVGRHLATLHAAGIVHGDPTVRNVRVTEPADVVPGGVALIDFGLGYHSGHREDRAMDLHMFRQSVAGTMPDPDACRSAVLDGYRDRSEDLALDGAAVLERLAEIEGRGRYQ